jgi:hypothetical protein
MSYNFLLSHDGGSELNYHMVHCFCAHVMNPKLALGGATFYVTFIFQKNYKVKMGSLLFFLWEKVQIYVYTFKPKMGYCAMVGTCGKL